MKERLKSKVVWLSVLAQVLIIVGLVCGDNVADYVKAVGVPILEILSLFGILNNPTDKNAF